MNCEVVQPYPFSLLRPTCEMDKCTHNWDRLQGKEKLKQFYSLLVRHELPKYIAFFFKEHGGRGQAVVGELSNK